MLNKQILRSIASITKRIGGDLGSPIIDKITPADSRTFTGEIIVADGTMDSYSGDIIIEGKTLQNILPGFTDESVYVHSSGVEVVDGSSLQFNKMDEHDQRTYSIMDKIDFVLDKSYSIFYDLQGDIKGFELLLFPEFYTSIILDSNFIRPGDNGRNIVTVRSDNTKSNKDKGIGFAFRPDNTDDITRALFKNVMLIEGDHTDKYHINYFSGVHSLGESGKLFIKCSNKNLCTKSNNFKEGDLIGLHSGVEVSYHNGEAIIKKLINAEAMHVNIGPPILLERGKTYYVVAELSSNDSSKTSIALRNNYNGVFLIQSAVTSDPVKYITCTPTKTGFYSPSITTTLLGVDSKITVKSCYVGTVPMGDTFVPHEENIIEIPLSEPLRSIDTIGLSDKIKKIGNRFYIERNIGKCEVNGDTAKDWINHSLDNDNLTISFKTESLMDIAMKGTDTDIIYCVSSYLKGDTHRIIYQENGNYVTGISLSESGRLYIRILKNGVLPSDNLNGFKEFVRDNPFYILYPLKEPVYEELDIDDIQVELYPEQSWISAYDEILNGKTTIDVPMNIMSIISNDIRKINSIDKEVTKAEEIVLTETMNLISFDEQFNNHIQKI